MSERYRLVFRGEILEGQDKAAVKQRLGAALKVDGARLDSLFTGKAVVIRKDADTDAAARFQVLFKRVGARLRVLPVERATPRGEDEPSDSTAAPVSTASATTITAAEPAATVNGSPWQLAPVGARLTEPRDEAPAPNIDVEHFTLAAPGARIGPAPEPTVAAPDVSHLSVAAAGETLAPPATDQVPVVAAPAWRIAPPGSPLARRAPDVAPPVDVDALGFDVAPPGTRLHESDEAAPPPPPDTSHLSLE